MRKGLLFISIIFSIIGCTSKDRFIIQGTALLPEMEGKSVWLSDPISGKDIDSTKVTSGKFEFEGFAKKSELYVVSIDQNSSSTIYATLILVKPGTATVQLGENIIIGGNSSNDDYQQYRDKDIDSRKRMEAVELAFQNTPEDQRIGDFVNKLEEEYDAARQVSVNLCVEYIMEHPEDLLAQHVFILSAPLFSADQIDAIIAKLDENTKQRAEIVQIVERVNRMNKVKVGQKFSDVTLQNLAGEPVSLSNYVGHGKYVLLDFWASWCEPCVREMPTLVEAYKKYKNQGFEIVGISLDDNKDALTKACENLKMTWPQMSDLKGWNSVAGKMYVVESIPHTILLDKEGIIIEKNLRGQALLTKLSQILK